MQITFRAIIMISERQFHLASGQTETRRSYPKYVSSYNLVDFEHITCNEMSYCTKHFQRNKYRYTLLILWKIELAHEEVLQTGDLAERGQENTRMEPKL